MEEFIRYLKEKWKLLILIIGSIGFVFIALRVETNIGAKEEDEAAGLEVYEELLTTKEQEAEKEEITVENDEEKTKVQEVVVDVKGAVKAPGVYEMDSDSRMIDAIAKAGGFLDTAEQNAINLAQIVEDQMVIYVPEIGEEGFELESVNQASVSGNNQEEEKRKVNINTANKEDLMTLSGIGDSKADKIIQYREETGLFQTIEGIKNVSGIGEATFENLKDSIIVSP